MDAKRFDQLTKVLSAVGSRRGLLHLPAALPFAGALAALLAGEASEAKRRGHGAGHVRASNHKHKGRRRKHKNHHGQSKNKKRKKHCAPVSPAETCAGACGTVLNNCRQAVDCGSCACTPPCPVCQICDAGSRQCVPDSNVNGQACDDGDPCTTGETCQGGVCGRGSPVACDSPGECRVGPGFCDAASGQCHYPAASNGTRCGDKCTQACTVGICGAGAPVICPPAPNECQNAGICNPTTGVCSAPTNKVDGTPCATGVCCDGTCEGCCVDTDCPGCEICAGDNTCDPLICEEFATCSGSAHTCTCVVDACSSAPCPAQQVCVAECCCKLNNELCAGDDECCSGSCIPGTDGLVCTLSGCGQPCAVNENCNLAPCFACVGGVCQG